MRSRYAVRQNAFKCPGNGSSNCILPCNIVVTIPLENQSRNLGVSEVTDYYAILGILPSADDTVIKAVYRALVKKWHPDTFSGPKSIAERKIKEINEAYETLSNAAARAEYDRGRSAATQQQREYEESDSEERGVFEEELAEDWKFVRQYYPAVETMRLELTEYSAALALTFQVHLLEMKAFARAGDIQQSLINDFLRTYFGGSDVIRECAKRLIRAGHKQAARELNRLIRLSGTPTGEDAHRIVASIEAKFSPVSGTNDKSRVETERSEINVTSRPRPYVHLAIWIAALAILLPIFLAGSKGSGMNRTGLFLFVAVAIAVIALGYFSKPKAK